MSPFCRVEKPSWPYLEKPRAPLMWLVEQLATHGDQRENPFKWQGSLSFVFYCPYCILVHLFTVPSIYLSSLNNLWISYIFNLTTYHFSFISEFILQATNYNCNKQCIEYCTCFYLISSIKIFYRKYQSAIPSHPPPGMDFSVPPPGMPPPGVPPPGMPVPPGKYIWS